MELKCLSGHSGPRKIIKNWSESRQKFKLIVGREGKKCLSTYAVPGQVPQRKQEREMKGNSRRKREIQKTHVTSKNVNSLTEMTAYC